jgi:hypothetical protein
VRHNLFKLLGFQHPPGWNSVRSAALLASCFRMGPCFACSSSLTMQATCCCEKLVDVQRIIWCYVPEDGRAIAQAVSRRLSNAETRFRSQVRTCGICGGQSGTGEGFLRVHPFPLQILIPPTAPHSSSSITRGWYNRPISGRRTKWNRSHPTPRNWLNYPRR